MNNLISKHNCITNNENAYKNWKISIILHNVYIHMISLGYGIDFNDNENGVTWETNNEIIDLITQLYDKLKLLDFSNIIHYELKRYDYDDIYVLLLFDNDHNIIYKYFWDFDMCILDELSGYDFIDDFDIDEWLEFDIDE